MRIAVQKDTGSFWRMWKEEIITSGNECILLDLRVLTDFDEALKCDGVMWHIDMEPAIQSAASSRLTSLEGASGKVVFPNFNTKWHFDNKVSQAYLFRQMSIPTPETNVFWHEDDAMLWVHSQGEFPVVAKLKRGAGSAAVYILRNQREAERYIRRMFSLKGISGETGGAKRSPYRIWRDLARKLVLRLPRPMLQHFLKERPRLREVWPNERGYAYFQEFIPGNDFDTRITVIGNRAFAFRRFNRDGDFRASGSGNIDYSVIDIDLEMVRIAHDLSFKNNLQSMAYDFLTDKEGKPTIVEISYAYQSKAVFDCPGHWDRELNWVDGHVLPEAAHVEDFINEIKKSKREVQ